MSVLMGIWINFKFNFLLLGQCESLSIKKFFLPLFKTLPCCEVFSVTSVGPLLLECCAEIIDGCLLGVFLY